MEADGRQLGVLPTHEAIAVARGKGVDLVEVAPNANPPVCRLVNYGKYRYEQAKKEKENRKHQHGNEVKEVQLTVRIDSHDLGVKVSHAVDFLCEDMKVKVSLRFRGREMAHTELGFQVVERFLSQIAPYGHADFEPKLNGRHINLMISPLPRSKRAPSPRAEGKEGETPDTSEASSATPMGIRPAVPVDKQAAQQSGFQNNPFSEIQVKQG